MGLRVRWIFGVTLLSFGGLVGNVLADGSSPDSAIAKGVLDVVTKGVAMFNSGDQLGCQRLYQGALLGLTPMLDHHPDLKKAATDALAKAETLHSTSDAAFALRAGLDAVLAGTRQSSKKSLWDRLGGESAVKAVVHDFVVAAAPDPKVNFFRSGQYKLDAAGVAALEQKLVELVSAVSGGPLKYTGRDMKSSHAGMKITGGEFDALAGHLVATLQKYNVPRTELDELVGIVASTKKDIVEVVAKPLWDRLGGEPAVRAVVKEFLVSAAKDPKSNIDRNGNYPLTPARVARVEQLVVEQISSVTGGPLKYTGRDMKNSHAGMKITEDEFNAAAGHLVGALKKFKVPQDLIDELVGVVSSVKKDIVGQ